MYTIEIDLNNHKDVRDVMSRLAAAGITCVVKTEADVVGCVYKRKDDHFQMILDEVKL
jgi:uncharacterized glyoxalase superfamily protein PhnB